MEVFFFSKSMNSEEVMTEKKEEYNPKDRMIYLKSPHIVLRDVNICEVRVNGEDPKYVLVPKGTIVVLENDAPHYCRTKENGCSFGCLYKITETSGVEIEERFIGRVVAIPPQFVDLRHDVL